MLGTLSHRKPLGARPKVDEVILILTTPGYGGNTMGNREKIA